jgi:hypothetical protein
MIPADLTARLRLLTEASFFQTEPPVHELSRVAPVPADPQEYPPGQRFTAVIQQQLPNGLFRALVAGKILNIALQHPARQGQALELEVTDNAPEAVHARLIQQLPDNAAPRPALSQAARLISTLLRGPENAEPARIAGGKPIVNAPPASGAQLAPALRTAVTESGLFYESHQAQWLSGQFSIKALRREPQGQNLPASNKPSADAGPAAQGTPLGARAADAEQAESAARQLGARAEQLPARQPAGIPERVMPVVHQQLDALSTHVVVLQGQVWPGQEMEWEIEDPDGRTAGAEGDAREWRTTLRLTLPHLGGVEARMVLTPAGLALRLDTDEPATGEALRAGQSALQDALAAAGLTLTGMSVESPDGG